MTIKEPEALDMILEYLLANKDKWVNPKAVYKEKFNGVEYDIFKYLINILTQPQLKIIESRVWEGFGNEEYSISLKATTITNQFLKNGGYTKVYADAKSEQERKSLERELNIKSNAEQIKTNKLSLIIAISAVLVTILSIIINYLLAKNH